MQNQSLLLSAALGLSLLLTGCAGTPVFDTAQVATSLTPDKALAAPQKSLGKRVLWGGTIVDTRNLPNVTQIEVLAYPLDSSFRPRLNRQAIMRVLVQQAGFLEPQVYAKGRKITVLGTLQKIASGRIGEADYEYPVVAADKIKLWSESENKTRFSLGIGLRL
jgi:outer membrane lipoprotein